MKVLLIEGDAAWRALLRQHLGTAWHDDLRITELAPAAACGLDDGFAGGDHELVLLGLAAAREPGLDWLHRFAARQGFPPVVALADDGGDEFLAVQAMRAGAADYLPKPKLRHATLIAHLRAALARRVRQDPSADALALHELNAMKGHRVIRQLHDGEVSAVYLARVEASGEERVFKIFRNIGDGEELGALFDRFLREYQVIAALESRYVVRIHDLGVTDDHVFIAMEHLPSGTLARRIAAGMTPAQAMDALRQLAMALSAVHAAGILHRDLKPGNVMVREDGSLALIDFGLAREMRLRAGSTGRGRILGTPTYMSPEQGHGEEIDQRSDLYSLGVIFYEMLTGERPFTAASPMSLIYSHRNAARPRLPAQLQSLQPLLERMLAAEPQARFQSADALLARIGTGAVA